MAIKHMTAEDFAAQAHMTAAEHEVASLSASQSEFMAKLIQSGLSAADALAAAKLVK